MIESEYSGTPGRYEDLLDHGRVKAVHMAPKALKHLALRPWKNCALKWSREFALDSFDQPNGMG